MQERLGIVGGGAIACGLAAVAAKDGDVVLWARSEESADRSRKSLDKICGRQEVDPSKVRVTTDLSDLSGVTAVIEAIAEDLDAKSALLPRIAEAAPDDALLGSTTSSLSVSALASAAGAPERFVGLHVFNPVPRMALVELAFPDEATQETRERAHALCAALGKTAVDVPDTPGFVVNKLLFPYLFSAVRFLEESGLEPEAIDTCMKLGAGHPMGPLALLDYVGLDVAKAIGESIGEQIPRTIEEKVAAGQLGKKTGAGFYAA
ncbi:3-hydroxyacyl-CoA dehydrogenase family protein [Conexibacter sp. SYSU D00693]|uniref:3-hydroxyacyl-CoA dehydrogenase family protein n=1 Tax=Conexibacter sp. SYSU D00693 TaxID=2812560 RepID=UPI00196B2310|nr:3-hydroxyacyl-CoA dehydrogenase family protein [Conexibacter sp. SYSU D00693]